jgi:hypothetical protein
MRQGEGEFGSQQLLDVLATNVSDSDFSDLG